MGEKKETITRYSWIGPQEQPRKKLICQQTEIATNIPKPPLESSQKGASSPGGDFFCIVIFCGVVLRQIFNNGFTKKGQPRRDASRRELSYGGLGSFVTISVCWQIDFFYNRLKNSGKTRKTNTLCREQLARN